VVVPWCTGHPYDISRDALDHAITIVLYCCLVDLAFLIHSKRKIKGDIDQCTLP
jgi:hypothetical protein